MAKVLEIGVAGSRRAASPASAVILIPKQLRMEWTDAMALDNGLSDAAFRIASVVGTHVSRWSGDTFISQITIAAVTGKCERTVWAALKELEGRGYLLIERRDLGTTIIRKAKDGREIRVRAAGGKGVANTYKPAFERSQLSATTSGIKLAARCDLVWAQRSQNPARKVAADCDPTLTLSSKENPYRARGAEQVGCAATPAPNLGEPGTRLSNLMGATVFASWFSDVGLDAVDGKTVRLSVPTKFIAKHLRENYSDAVVFAWQQDHPQITRVEFVVRP